MELYLLNVSFRERTDQGVLRDMYRAMLLQQMFAPSLFDTMDFVQSGFVFDDSDDYDDDDYVYYHDDSDYYYSSD